MTNATTQQRIQQIEEVAADAVPPAVLETLGGWRLRFNHGVKRRPNSVLANHDDGTLALPDKISEAEAFYARYGLRARFQLCPASQPENLAALLEARGYRRPSEAVSVQTAPLATLTASNPNSALDLLPRPTEAWLELYSTADPLAGEQAAAFRQMLARLPGQVVFALARDAFGRPAAVGVGVVHGGLLGLFNIATHPDARRQGLASRVVAGLGGWGQQQGVSEAYLQVAGHNAGALAVYHKLGFETFYAYFYLEQP